MLQADKPYTGVMLFMDFSSTKLSGESFMDSPPRLKIKLNKERVRKMNVSNSVEICVEDAVK